MAAGQLCARKKKEEILNSSSSLPYLFFHKNVLGCFSRVQLPVTLWTVARCFPRDSVVKNLPAVQEPREMWVPLSSQEDPLKVGSYT